MPRPEPTRPGPDGVAERERDPETGRFKSKLTPELHEEVLKALRGGAPLDIAASYAGIWRQTFHEWLARGRTALRGANGDLPALLERDPYAALAFDVDQALAQFVVGNMAQIGIAGRTKSEGEWQALAWQLERRFPILFGRRTRHEVTGKDGGPIEHAIVLPPGSLDRLSLEDKLALADILAKLEGDIIDGEATEVGSLELES